MPSARDFRALGHVIRESGAQVIGSSRFPVEGSNTGRNRWAECIYAWFHGWWIFWRFWQWMACISPGMLASDGSHLSQQERTVCSRTSRNWQSFKLCVIGECQMWHMTRSGLFLGWYAKGRGVSEAPLPGTLKYVSHTGAHFQSYRDEVKNQQGTKKNNRETPGKYLKGIKGCFLRRWHCQQPSWCVFSPKHEAQATNRTNLMYLAIQEEVNDIFFGNLFFSCKILRNI